MAWIIVALSVLLVVAIGYVAIGQESVNLTDTPTRAFFDIDEAVDYVADTMPAEVAGRLTYEELELLIRWQVTYFRQRGVATFGGIDHEAQDASQAGVIAIADEDEVVDVLMDRAAWEGSEWGATELLAVDVVVVVDLTADYLAQIGAIGKVVEDHELKAITQAQSSFELDQREMGELAAAEEQAYLDQEAAASQEHESQEHESEEPNPVEGD